VQQAGARPVLALFRKNAFLGCERGWM
jgi:hypothetical protein